jgi:hypothetical protein
MLIPRDKLYRFPWSKTDNPGGWVEVTDECNLFCPGCYRHRLEGHRPLEVVKEEILICKQMTNCDRIGIAGGEPLLYPHILEVVEFVSGHGLKPLLLTNGELLTWEMASALKRAGLVKLHIHVDSGQRRPGWLGKTESEMNELRQHYADLLWELKGIQCGYNITIFPSTVKCLPDILGWARGNSHKVNHISLVAFRAIPVTDAYIYRVGGRRIDPRQFQHSVTDTDKICLTTEDMYEILKGRYADYQASAYLGGTSAPETYKFLVTVQVGGKGGVYGYMGAKTLELTQIFYHLFTGRYFDFLRSPKAGKKLFFLAPVDKQVRKTLGNFLRQSLKSPRKFFQGLYAQSISLQQPNEIIEGEVNLCDGCMNMMPYQGRMVHSCRLDEHRMFGAYVTPQKRSPESP